MSTTICSSVNSSTVMYLKATPLLVLSIIFAIRSIAAGPVSSGESDVIPGSKRAQAGPKYLYDSRRSKGLQGPFRHEQYTDHFMRNSETNTFNQRYWVNDEFFVRNYYESPNPVFLYISDQKEDTNKLLGEDPNSMFVRMAKRHSGMLVILEHRYFGKSYPVNDLSEKNMQYLTIAQVLRDVETFAANGMGHTELRARSIPANSNRYFTQFVPWVLVGVGYTGGLVHWAMTPKRSVQNVFWAGYSSSGMVQAKENFWEYWDETSRIMPPGCVQDVAEVVKYFDAVFYSDLKEKESAKRLGAELGLRQIKHADDMAQILSHAIDYGSSHKRVERLCKALKHDDDGNIPEDESTRLSRALEGWKIYNKKTYSNDSDSTWSSHDMRESKYNDLKPHSVSIRVTKWLRCNEFGWFKVAPDPQGVKTVVVSRSLNVERERRICQKVFPRRYKGNNSAPSADVINKEYGGSSKKPARRVFYTNGSLDPNLSLTLAEIEADDVVTVENAASKSDIELPNENPDIEKVIDKAIKRIGIWLQEWMMMTPEESDSDSG